MSRQEIMKGHTHREVLNKGRNQTKLGAHVETKSHVSDDRRAHATQRWVRFRVHMPGNQRKHSARARDGK